jgi:hypothetical protein
MYSIFQKKKPNVVMPQKIFQKRLEIWTGTSHLLLQQNQNISFCKQTWNSKHAKITALKILVALNAVKNLRTGFFASV